MRSEYSIDESHIQTPVDRSGGSDTTSPRLCLKFLDGCTRCNTYMIVAISGRNVNFSWIQSLFLGLLKKDDKYYQLATILDI